MKIICETCQSKYTVADEKVQGKTAKIKCKKCGATILVNSTGVVSTTAGGAAPPSSGAAAADGPSFMVNVADGDQRTMTLDEIVGAYNDGTIDAETYIWSEGMADWQPLAGVDAVVAALNAQAPEAAASAPARVVEVAQPAAARAAVRRDHGRAAADLFGGGGGMQASEPVEAPLFTAPAPSGAGMSATGQRDENSMLFSLSALTAKAPPSTSSMTTATKDDSGLIDLRALGAGQPPSSVSSDFLPDSIALFPLGVPAAPAPSQPPVVAAVAPPAKSKAPMFIVVGVIVALAAVAGAFFLVKGTPPPPPQAAVAPVEAKPVETVAAAPTEAPPAETAPAASASASAAVAVATPKTYTKPAGGGAKPAGTATAGGGTKPAATAAPPKKGNCGCAAGDLMCAMKCSAGK